MKFPSPIFVSNGPVTSPGTDPRESTNKSIRLPVISVMALLVTSLLSYLATAGLIAPFCFLLSFSFSGIKGS